MENEDTKNEGIKKPSDYMLKKFKEKGTDAEEVFERAGLSRQEGYEILYSRDSAEDKKNK